MDTKGCGQLTSRDTYFADSLFGGVKISEEAMAKGVDYCRPVKMIHKGFCIATLEKLMRHWPVKSYLVMNSTPRFPGGRPFMDIGYKCNYRKITGFISTGGYGSTDPGDPYLSCFPYMYSNISVLPIFHPHLLGIYFNACNSIDNNNRILRSDIALYRYWVTHSGYLRLETTVELGMGITDGKLLFCHGNSEGTAEKKFSAR